MSSQLALERGSVGAAPPERSPFGLVAAAAAVRGAAVAVSGALLAAAVSLVLWSLTPASGSDAMVATKAGVAGFAAANLIPVTIGGVALTIPPLLFTGFIVALLMVTARRGRFLPVGRGEETAAVGVTAASYGLVVAIITRGFAPEGVVPAGWVWTAAALALLATAAAMAWAGSAWHQWWRSSVAGWLRSAARAAGIGLGVMIAGGGAALTVAMVLHFGSMVSVGALAAPSWTDGLGITLLGAAYIPNAVVAAVGYVSAVGFEIGPATFSPFGSTPVDLPALPLFAAAPEQPGRSLLGLALLSVPLIAGYLMARRVSKNLDSRSQRVLAVVTAAAGTGILLGALSWLARGGVGTARWASMGVPPLLVGVVVAGELAAVGGAVAVLTGIRTVPWRAAGPGVVADVGDTGLEADLADADLADADLADADLADADLADTELADADLADGDLDDADVIDGDGGGPDTELDTDIDTELGPEVPGTDSVDGAAADADDAARDQVSSDADDDRVAVAEPNAIDTDARTDTDTDTDTELDTDTAVDTAVDTGIEAEAGQSLVAEGGQEAADPRPSEAADRSEEATAEESTQLVAGPIGSDDAEQRGDIDTTVAGPGITLPEQRVHSDDRVAPGRPDSRD